MAWNGTISFGLVAVPVKLELVAKDKGLAFNQLHDADGGRVGYTKTCKDCGETLSADEIVKGFSIGADEYVRMTDADFDELPLAAKKVVAMDSFVPRGQVPTSYISGKHYNVEPQDVGLRGFTLLVEAMLENDVEGIGTIAFRESKAHLALVQTIGSGLQVHTLHWNDEVGDAYVPARPDVSQEEFQMAVQLVENLTADFQPERYKDTYREMLTARIDAKAAGKPIPKVKAQKENPAGDLMEQLKASLKPAKKAAPKKRRTA